MTRTGYDWGCFFGHRPVGGQATKQAPGKKGQKGIEHRTVQCREVRIWFTSHLNVQLPSVDIIARGQNWGTGI